MPLVITVYPRITISQYFTMFSSNYFGKIETKMQWKAVKNKYFCWKCCSRFDSCSVNGTSPRRDDSSSMRRRRREWGTTISQFGISFESESWFHKHSDRPAKSTNAYRLYEKYAIRVHARIFHLTYSSFDLCVQF